MNTDWIKQFNKLFERINDTNSPSYFSGPRFIKVVQEFDEGFIDYKQYIEYRIAKGLSTTRKTYFFDILSAFREDVKETIVKRIYEIAEASEQENVTEEIAITPEEIESSTIVEKEEPVLNFETLEEPIIFISYSWDTEEHKNWVLNLAKRLSENGIDVILDRYDLTPGSNKAVFMETALNKANKVLVVFTPNYKLKADHRQGGVGVEYSILNNELYRRIADNSKYIPILRFGTFEDSIPEFIQQFIAVDMRDDSQYEERIRELTLAIYNKPIIAKPEKGVRPDYV